MHKILFLCVENSCRSQIAEAFAIKHGKNKVIAMSAGSRPSGIINETAILLMREFNYDLSSHQSSATYDLPEMKIHTMVSMGCGDSCPSIIADQKIEWDIPDPKDMEESEFLRVIEQIRCKVQKLIETIYIEHSL